MINTGRLKCKENVFLSVTGSIGEMETLNWGQVTDDAII